MGRVGFDPRSSPPWYGRSPVSHPTCHVPFPPRRTGGYRKGMISARPLYLGVRRSVWDPETSRERVGDWGRLETVWALLCVAERRATRPNGEWGYSARRHMLGPERPEAVTGSAGAVEQGGRVPTARRTTTRAAPGCSPLPTYAKVPKDLCMVLLQTHTHTHTHTCTCSHTHTRLPIQYSVISFSISIFPKATNN
jgi:hypothetical protein